MPFKCPFCGESFCAAHRLPENHECPEYWRVRARREKPPEAFPTGRTAPSYQYTVTVTPPGIGKVGWFSSTELKHLLLGLLLTLAIGFSWPLYVNFGLYGQPDVLTMMALAFAFSFMIHEVAHKTTAQRYGLWAEFRITTFGAMITLLSIISPIKLISPGAVMVGGAADKKTIGKVSIAGPLTNVALAGLFLALLAILPRSGFDEAFLFGLLMNSFIALFNLIPFGILDGAKILAWNKAVWALAFAASLGLTVYANILTL
jgi:Zn-dependent protease